ncbi:crosslink repair DNA glycosylase YcaQ family protein [Actinotalea sp. AC32]|nr:crosslink repair DNA glycosylase YcaQ family protein [Actinotalea sp. AC32]
MVVQVTREQVLLHRERAQQLDRAPASTTDALSPTVLDAGVQDTGPDGAAWALVLRGVEPAAARAALAAGDDPPAPLALAWTLRGAPHAYRRADLPGVLVAVQPWSHRDAARRVLDASRPLTAAGIPSGVALAAVARTMREVVTGPVVKGDVSTLLTGRMPEPFLRWCRPCGATHLYEMPFRLAALHAGLELDPGTSPPVLRPVPGWPRDLADRAAAALEHLPDGLTGDEPPPDGPDVDGPGGDGPLGRTDAVVSALRLLGPMRAAELAGYLDAHPADVRVRIATSLAEGRVAEVDVDGTTAVALTEDVEALRSAGPSDRGVVRLLGPFDLFLQARDRERLVPDAARRKELWPTLGRPGAVLHDGEVVGTWRPRSAGSRLRVQLDPWVPWAPAVEEGVDEQVALLGAFRGVAASRA